MIPIYDFEDSTKRSFVLELLETKAQRSGTQLISYYCPVWTDQRVQKIQKQLNLSKSIKSEKTKALVLSGLDTLLDVMGKIRNSIGESPFVIFVKEKFYLVLRLPTSLSMSAYYCSKKFIIDPIKNHSDLVWGLLVLDNSEVTIGLLRNHRVEVLKSYDVFLPGKIKAGGQSQVRFEQTRKNLVTSHLKKTSQLCEQLFQTYKVSKILFGGISPTMEQFFTQNSLSVQFNKILQRPVSVQYTNKQGLYQLVEKKRPFYETELAEYLRNRQIYTEHMVDYRELRDLRSLNYVEKYEILKIYTCEDRLPKYCVDCKNLNQHCDHEKKDLNEISPIITFDPCSEWGYKIYKTAPTLFKINILE